VDILVELSPHITNAEIEAETSLHPPIIKEILHESLNLKNSIRAGCHINFLSLKKKNESNVVAKIEDISHERKLRVSDIFTGE
jgi:hypothetical protein